MEEGGNFMKKRKVINTSTGGLDYYPFSHDIEILRIKVSIHGQEYQDGLTLKADEFYQKLNEDRNLLPKTSQSSVGEIVELFQKCLDAGVEEIFVVTISSEMSGTYNSCVLAAKEFENKMKIIVFDTKTVCFSEGLFALEAEKLLNEEIPLEVIEEKLIEMRKANTIFFAVDSLNYLVKNGRLSNAAGFVGKMLKLKPILQVQESGKIVSIEKIRTTRAALQSITSKVKTFTHGRPYHAYILYTGNPKLKSYFIQIIKEDLGLVDLYESPSTPVVGAHVGPDVIGIGIFLDHDSSLPHIEKL
jgi:DegV family protein with EDD domain